MSLGGHTSGSTMPLWSRSPRFSLHGFFSRHTLSGAAALVQQAVIHKTATIGAIRIWKILA